MDKNNIRMIQIVINITWLDFFEIHYIINFRSWQVMVDQLAKNDLFLSFLFNNELIFQTMVLLYG